MQKPRFAFGLSHFGSQRCLHWPAALSYPRPRTGKTVSTCLWLSSASHSNKSWLQASGFRPGSWKVVHGCGTEVYCRLRGRSRDCALRLVRLYLLLASGCRPLGQTRALARLPGLSRLMSIYLGSFTPYRQVCICSLLKVPGLGI